MKKSILLFSVMVTMNVIAQDPQEPCCAVAGINRATNTVIARNTATGQLFSFNVDAMDIRSIRLQDPVTANSDMTVITAINGSIRKYNSEPVNGIKSVKNSGEIQIKPEDGIARINWLEPCCNITQIDNIEPCCGLVTAKNKTTGATIQFKASKLVLSSVKTGDPVYVEPCCALAIVQSAYQGNGGQLNSFGYPIESGTGNGQENSSDKWVISPATMKGVLGRLNTSFPPNVQWSMDVRNASDNKFLTNRSGFSKHGPSYDLAPGLYNFQLNTILVENVPVERGKETRLKAGVLNIVSAGDWNLYNETKQKFHTSGNKPTMLALPVGSYQLKLGEQFYPIVIKDKETVEY